jgi:hypothetical protein
MNLNLISFKNLFKNIEAMQLNKIYCVQTVNKLHARHNIAETEVIIGWKITIIVSSFKGIAHESSANSYKLLRDYSLFLLPI